MTISKKTLFQICACIIVLSFLVPAIIKPEIGSNYAAIITISLQHAIDLFSKSTDTTARLTEFFTSLAPDFSGTAN